jgi:elongation factor Ts
VALNERFASLGQSCAEYLARLPGEPTIAPLRERIDETAAIIKENILPGTVHHFDAKMGQYLTGYLHGDAAKMGSLVLLDVAGARSNAVKKAAHELALHVVAAAPRFLSEESIPVEHRNAVIREFREESAGLGKPADLIERIVEGRWIKYVAATCLMRQKFFRDEQLTVSDWLATASEHANGTIAVSGIAYARTGE